MSTTAQNKANIILNTITGSSWPSNTNVGILTSLDYFIEEGTNDVYFNEMNTACGVYGTYNEQTASFNLMADYVNEKGCTTVYIYGQNDSEKCNPSFAQQPLISSSFARHNISVNFEYNGNTSHTYFSQRGQAQYSGSFHLFFQTPWYSDDSLLNIVSGSFNKSNWRTILGSSPVSSSLVPLFNTGSFSSNNQYHPDYLVRNPGGHATGFQSLKSLEFHKYNPSTNVYQNAVDSGSLLIEKYIVSSGSVRNSIGYFSQKKLNYVSTPDKHILLNDIEQWESQFAPSFKLIGDRWTVKNTMMFSTASGSLISMFDGSTKQVQDVEVGDIVKSYKPIGLPDEFSGEDWDDYSTTDLTGSEITSSVVVRTFNSEMYGYALINDSIKVPFIDQSLAKGMKYFVKSGNTWSWKTPGQNAFSIGNKLLNSSEEEVEIVSLTQVSESMDFYSLDVEDIDTYFQSDVVVHNLPPK